MRFASVFRYLRLRPLSEDAGAHAHTSRAFRDGNFEIVRHAHGEDGHVNVRKPARPDSITEFTQLSKIRTRSFRIISEWRYGHEAPDVDVVELRCGFENGIEFMRLGIDATLCLFPSHVHFDQNAQSFP